MCFARDSTGRFHSTVVDPGERVWSTRRKVPFDSEPAHKRAPRVGDALLHGIGDAPLPRFGDVHPRSPGDTPLSMCSSGRTSGGGPRRSGRDPILRFGRNPQETPEQLGFSDARGRPRARTTSIGERGTRTGVREHIEHIDRGVCGCSSSN